MSERLPTPAPEGTTIAIGDGGVEIDASVVGQGLGLKPQEILQLMRDGAITAVYEEGVDDDAGRHRLTFFYKGRRLRLVVEDSGRVVQRSLIDFGERPLPPRLHGAGR